MGNAGSLVRFKTIPVPVYKGVTIKKIGHPVWNESSSVVAVVYYQSFLVIICIHAMEKLPVAVSRGVRNMDIANSSS